MRTAANNPVGRFRSTALHRSSSRLGIAALAALTLLAEPAAPANAARASIGIRSANHPGFGRIVFDAPPGTHYRLTQEDGRVLIHFSGNVRVAASASAPRNVRSIAGRGAEVEIAAVAGATLHHMRRGKHIIVDVFNPAPAAASSANLPASAPEPARPAVTEPLPAPSAPPPALPPAGPVALSVTRLPAGPGRPSGFIVPFPAGTGAAAFQRGGIIFAVFDERRPIDLSAMRADPVFGAATVQLLPAATMIRIPVPAGLGIALSAQPKGWQIATTDTAPRIHPVGRKPEDGRLLLQAEAPGKVVTLTDRDTGSLLLAGTLRREGQGITVARRTPQFALIPCLLGALVEPLADSIALRALPDGFALTAANGLALSPATETEGALADAAALTRRFGIPAMPVEAMRALLQRQIAEAASAPPQRRGPRRQAAARTMIGLGMAAEAEALLHAAAAQDPNLAGRSGYPGLVAVAALLADRPAEADGILDPALTGADEVLLWRAVRLAAFDEASPEAASLFAATAPLILTYAAPMRERLLPLALETMALGGEAGAAAALLAQQQSGTSLDLARAMVAEASHDTDTALKLYATVAGRGDQLAYVRATARRTELLLSTGQITAARAAAALERLSYAWRGDGRELALRERAAALLQQSGQWQSALSLLRETEALFPQRKQALHAQMQSAFAAMLQEGATGSLPALDFVALVEDNADLLAGAPGNVEEQLADRLLSLDLPKRAEPLLEKLMHGAPPGASRARFGARLAALRLRETDGSGALEALIESASPDIPPELGDQRRLLFAQASARKGDIALATAILDDIPGQQADEARAEILERAQDWPGATHALTALAARTVPASGPLDSTQRNTLLRLATAASRAGDTATLGALKPESQRMGSGSAADMFRLLTADPVRATTDLKRAGQEIGLARSLVSGNGLNAIQPVRQQSGL